MHYFVTQHVEYMFDYCTMLFNRIHIFHVYLCCMFLPCDVCIVQCVFLHMSELLINQLTFYNYCVISLIIHLQYTI